MLDLKVIRENLEAVKKGVANKRVEINFDQILDLDSQRREMLQAVEDLKRNRNQFSQEVSQLKKSGKDASDLITRVRGIGDEIKVIEEKLRKVQLELGDLLDRIPNLPHASTPVGMDASENVEVQRWGNPITFDFEAKDHLALGESLGLFDFTRGSKVTGRGFPAYTGKGARLERSLINFMMDTHSDQHHYQEILPPFLANAASMRGTGQLPKMAEDMYYIGEDNLYLIPTAEVSVTNLHRDEILDEATLPIRYCAYSPCFRREAGSWGKDTRGFLRLHQFNKVELVKFVLPEQSYDELEGLRKDACRILELLNIPYRVIELVSGDLSFAAAKCYDIEVWSPIEEKWLEASSCSNFEDFQARRMNARFRRKSTGKPEFLHTLNGSGLATPRLTVALLENNQNADGSITIPEALQPYTGFSEIKG